MGIIIGTIVIWSAIGLLPCWIWSNNKGTDGWELCNPYWVYQYHYVNWFGAVLLSLLFNLFSPIPALCYWIYKICTVGRH